MKVPTALPIRPPVEPASAPTAVAERHADADFSERLARLQAHNERALQYPDATYALLERTQGDFLFVQSLLASALTAKHGMKPATFEELANLMPTIADMTKLGKTIAQLEKLLLPYRRELNQERSGDEPGRAGKPAAIDAGFAKSEES